MRIVIDIQDLQANSHPCGLPDGLLNFFQSLVLNRGEREIFFLLDASYPGTIEPIRSAFQGLLPQSYIRLWHSPELQSVGSGCQETCRMLGEIIRGAAIRALLPDVVHVTYLLTHCIQGHLLEPGRLDHHAAVSVGLLDDLDHTYDLDCHRLSALFQSTRFLSESDHFRFAVLKAELYERFAPILSETNLCSQIPTTTDEWQVFCLCLFEAWDGHAASWLLNQRHENELGRSARTSLAFVSPIPPLQTGIADYSAELIPALAHYFDITVVTDQESLVKPPSGAGVNIQSDEWFRLYHRNFDSVLYQLGNSPFHAYIVPLIREIPGILVLHEAILDDLCFCLRDRVRIQEYGADAIYSAFGYRGLAGHPHLHSGQRMARYSILDLLNTSTGIIVHSEHCRDILAGLYGSLPLAKLDVIPLLRSLAGTQDKSRAKASLGFNSGDYLVCSFGNLNPFKLPERLLDCWLASSLFRDPNCYLLYVGPCDNSYGIRFHQLVRSRSLEGRVIVTGFLSTDQYQTYLAAADVAVQLRTNSHGETSAAIADCLNHALPLIVNSHGSAAELNDDVAIKLPDEFANSELTCRLESLREYPALAESFGVRARDHLQRTASPAQAASKYRDAIHSSHARLVVHSSVLADRFLASVPAIGDCVSLRELAKAIALTIPDPKSHKCIYVDVSETRRHDLRTGIQRVVRAILLALLNNPPTGYRVEPVFFSHEQGKWLLYYARGYSLDLINAPLELLLDDICEPCVDDYLVCLDYSVGCVLGAARQGLFLDYRNRGVRIVAVVYDLLPVLMPAAFPKESSHHHAQWLREISRFNSLVCISNSVADELRTWLEGSGLLALVDKSFMVSWFHLGADLRRSLPTTGLPNGYRDTLAKLQGSSTFLMVGTVEPLKGHLQVLRAFMCLWQERVNCNLVIVGKSGWDGQSSDVNDTLMILRKSRELNNRLYWLEAISDEYLEEVYSASACLIAASYGEGFGLPLIEAAQHSLPIIARDIPVFREVAGDSAFYFSDCSPESLAQSLLHWLSLYSEGRHPTSESLAWLTWEQSANMLLKEILPSAEQF